MMAFIKKYQSALGLLLATHTAVVLVLGLVWKAFAHERVRGTAQMEARRIVSDSLAPVRTRVQAHQTQLDSLPGYMRKVAEDIGTIKDFMVESNPDLLRKVKENRDLKK